MKVGLVLIGGSLKGIYGHTGVVSALHQLKIKPDVILGASAGSVVGALYSCGKDIREMYKMMSELKTSDYLDVLPKWKLFYEFVFNHAKDFSGFVEGKALEDYIAKHLGNNNDFTKAQIPFYVSAFNLRTQELQLFSTGKVSDKVRASTSIPMLFCPKKIDGDYYIDGALKKYELPIALHDIYPDLDLMIVSHVDSELQSGENAFIPDNRFPIFEISRRALHIKDCQHWHKKLDNTNIIYVTPKVRTPVNIFKPNKHLARAVYHEVKAYTKHHLIKELAKLK
jgi:predicted acylesterase/phospholipase RssA